MSLRLAIPLRGAKWLRHAKSLRLAKWLRHASAGLTLTQLHSKGGNPKTEYEIQFTPKVLLALGSPKSQA